MYNKWVTKLGEIAARRIRSARESAGLTQAELADFLGITRAAVTGLENGRSTLTLQHLEVLPEILGRPMAYFLGLGEGAQDITPDEQELLNAYRAIPPGPYRRFALDTIQLWSKFQGD